MKEQAKARLPEKHLKARRSKKQAKALRPARPGMLLRPLRLRKTRRPGKSRPRDQIAEQAENAAETAKAGDPDYAGEEDELDDDTIAAPRNLRWEDRTGKWDAVKGAEKYKVELFRIGEDGKAGSMGTATPAGCAYTFDRIDLSVEGTYCFTVKAVIGEKESAAARSKEAKLGPVPAPGNPRWDGKIARWDAVEGHKSYNMMVGSKPRFPKKSCALYAGN